MFWPRSRLIRTALLVGGLALAAWLVWRFATIVLLVVLAGALALGLNPLVQRFELRGLARVPAVVVSFLVVIAFVAAVFAVVVPFAAVQLSAIGSFVTPERVGEVAAEVENGLQRYLPLPDGRVATEIQETIAQLLQQDRLGALVSNLVDLASSLAIGLLVVPFAAFFFLRDGKQMRAGLLARVPNRYFEPTLNLVEKLQATLGRYFRALLLQSASVAGVATVGLWAAGIESAIVVGVFTGLTNTIPYLGPALGFAAGSIVGIAQTGDFSLVPGVFVAMLVTQAADNLFFQPIYFSRAAQLHPLSILAAVLVGAEVGGLVGLLAAIPVLTVMVTLTQELLWSARNYRVLRSRPPSAPLPAQPPRLPVEHG